ATTRSDTLPSFANFGDVSVDLGAPGFDVLSTQPSFGFQDNFEVDDFATEWVANGAPGWERTASAAYSGSFSVTDSPGGNYPPSVLSSIRTAQPVPLNGDSCRISLQARLATVPGDFLFIDTSPDAATWTELGGVHGTTNGGWVPILAPLATSATPLYVRFRFVGDAQDEDDGFYLDEIRMGCIDTTYDGTEYSFSSGTSMAAAHVAGAAALLLSARPGASVASLRADLLNTGDPVPALVTKTATGRRLDVRAALLRDLVTTGAASEVTQTGARLGGTVRPPGPPTSYQFEYGTTTAYGSVAPTVPTAVGGLDATAVSDAISGLAPGTAYHFRLVAIVNGRRVGGADGVFTTAAAPKATGPAPKTLADVVVRRCRQSGRGKRTRLRCRLANRDALASARLQLKRGKKVIGRATAKPARDGTLTLRLKRRLAKGRYVLTLRLRDSGTATRTVRFRFRIR
ncbi:MAG TPA: S8 family serine peptidase, partial [Solirubrobacteraceae bacterium]|nr:S8 family serine peptidase [Solirubrobacteraceae bacterium]